MSQFLLFTHQVHSVTLPPDVQCIQVDTESQDKLLICARIELFPISDIPCWTVIDSHTMISDSLFTEAQQQVLTGSPLEVTRLGQILADLVAHTCTIVLWYGNDWHNLPITDDGRVFMAQVTDQILSPSCEVYLRYETKP